jgi:hypothetical protein
MLGTPATRIQDVHGPIVNAGAELVTAPREEDQLPDDRFSSTSRPSIVVQLRRGPRGRGAARLRAKARADRAGADCRAPSLKRYVCPHRRGERRGLWGV